LAAHPDVIGVGVLTGSVTAFLLEIIREAIVEASAGTGRREEVWRRRAASRGGCLGIPFR
jgi:hypothetical protein